MHAVRKKQCQCPNQYEIEHSSYREAVAGTPRRCAEGSLSGDDMSVFERRLKGSRRPVGVDVVLPPPAPCPFTLGGELPTLPGESPNRANTGDSGPNAKSSSRSSMRAPRPVLFVLAERVSTSGVAEGAREVLGVVRVRKGSGRLMPKDNAVGVGVCAGGLGEDGEGTCNDT